MIIEEIKNIKSGKKQLREFGVTVGIVLAMLGGLFLWRRHGHYNYFFIISSILIVLGLLRPALLKPIYKAWMALAVIMGWVMTRVILSILYYLVFTPLGMALRAFGKQFLDVKPNKAKKSYWNYRETGKFKQSDCEKQF